MLAVFHGAIIKAPEELVQAGNRTPTPKKTASSLMNAFLQQFPSAVSVNVGSDMQMSYSHENQPFLQPRSFAAKDEIFCLFEGILENLPRLKQQYGLGKNATEVVLVMEAYKALRDRAPYPASLMVAHLVGNFAFIIFDKATSTVFVASDEEGKVPLFWGITADGYLAFSDEIDVLRGSCGKSLASFPSGCLFSSATDLRSYQHPKHKVTAEPAEEEEICGATFKVEMPHLRATTTMD
ncbi:stem-specific protein TSJT1-like [Aristolochia californica]|uniref:stem-specific protein TSJT1-like n=1 Tax=Aristolochia californica TaxID=171875 RepID=UPI0035DF6639